VSITTIRSPWKSLPLDGLSMGEGMGGVTPQ
jgi:hypothetical protein